MNENSVGEKYRQWLEKVKDNELLKELYEMTADEEKKEDAFYKDLSFGTGGLRGIMGAGTNRMNIYTVARASQGVANYIGKYLGKNRKIAVSYDSRVNSYRFAKKASSVFAANDIEVFIFTELMPTPCLSFAVRELKCAAGIMITASHNPFQYNGYKVYGSDGCQITTEVSAGILSEIEKVDIFEDIQTADFEKAIIKGGIRYIPESVFTAFIENVKKQSMLDSNTFADKSVSIVYSPLNGTGLKPVLRVLNEMGYLDITVVKEQEQPDGYFLTCPYPNPENKDAMMLGLEYAKRENSDLFLATDPDCDRVGIAVRNKDGEYVLLSGNETGVLLLDYICTRHKDLGSMPDDPVMVKTIVTTDMAEKIADHYGVRTLNVLTGFKFIGEQIAMLEQRGSKDSFVFGCEESHGYLKGSYVRDKNAVEAVLLLCEMLAYYKTKGMGLMDKLEELYHTYGFSLNTLHSYKFEGQNGNKKMQVIMDKLRSGITEIGEKKVLMCKDYAGGQEGLPKSNVLKFFLDGNCSIVVRPSGTEPKLKVYISVVARSRAAAAALETTIARGLDSYF